MISENQPRRMQMVWKQSKKLTRPLPKKSFQFESANEDDDRSDSGTGGKHPNVSSQFGGLSVANSREKSENARLSEKLMNEGNVLAEDGKYGKALGKWETAIYLTPDKAILHEQKSQVLLEIGKTWGAVQAATCNVDVVLKSFLLDTWKLHTNTLYGQLSHYMRVFFLSYAATELQPTWTEAWVTLARAQLNYGEPFLAVESARAALRLEPGHEDATSELERAQFLAIKQRQATRESGALNEAEGGLSDGGNRLPSCRRAKVYDPQDIQFIGEHHQVAPREVEKDRDCDEKVLDKYDDDTYDWVDEVRKPPEYTTENLMDDFCDI